MATNSTILTANIVIDLPGSTASVSIEVDDRPDGSNGGKTSFSRGQKDIGLLVFIPDGYVIKQIFTTAGSIQNTSIPTTKPIQTALNFINEDSVQLSPSHGANPVTLVKVGESSSSTISVSGDTVSLNSRPQDSQGKLQPPYRVATYTATYDAPCFLFMLRNIPATSERVAILFVAGLK